MGDQAAGEFEECFVDVGSAFPADPQASEAVQPREASFDHPAVGAQSGAVRVPRRAMAGTMPRSRPWSR